MKDSVFRCLRYCKSTIFQANHNCNLRRVFKHFVVCDTAKVRFFKQITTRVLMREYKAMLFAILQKYDFSSKSQPVRLVLLLSLVVCDTAKVRFFKQITTQYSNMCIYLMLFAILQKYDFSSKSQHMTYAPTGSFSCLRYCKSTIFQANHN